MAPMASTVNSNFPERLEKSNHPRRSLHKFGKSRPFPCIPTKVVLDCNHHPTPGDNRKGSTRLFFNVSHCANVLIVLRENLEVAVVVLLQLVGLLEKVYL